MNDPKAYDSTGKYNRTEVVDYVVLIYFQDPSKRWELVKQLDVQPRLFHVTQARGWREVAQEQMLAPIGDDSAPRFRLAIRSCFSWHTGEKSL